MLPPWPPHPPPPVRTTASSSTVVKRQQQQTVYQRSNKKVRAIRCLNLSGRCRYVLACIACLLVQTSLTTRGDQVPVFVCFCYAWCMRNSLLAAAPLQVPVPAHDRARLALPRHPHLSRGRPAEELRVHECVRKGMRPYDKLAEERGTTLSWIG